MDARYGPWRVCSPLSNIRRVEITGPYGCLKTAGPPHVGLTDDGLIFASNHRRGVLIEFITPVPGIDPLGLIRHPELTVTVADHDRFERVVTVASGSACDHTGAGQSR